MLTAPRSKPELQSIAESNVERIDELEARLKTHEKYFNRILKELNIARDPED